MLDYRTMFPSKPSSTKWRKRLTPLTSLIIAGGLLAAACSSGESTPSSAGGAAGLATAAGAGASGSGTTAGAGGAGVAGGAGTLGTAGAGLGGSAAGSAGSGVAGSSGGVAGSSGGVAGGSGGVAGSNGGAGGSGGASGPFALTSSAFVEGAEIPLKYKCANVPPAGQNMSPPLSWGPGPAGTKSYAVVLNHVTTPEHWVIWDIPPSVTSLPEDIEHKAQPAAPAGSKQSLVNLDGFQGSGYLGPCPQAPNSRQSYKFTLYALDIATLPGLTATSTPAEAATVVKAHLVTGSQGVSLTGTQIQTP